MRQRDLKAARQQLVLKRNIAMRGLRTRLQPWSELQEICHEILSLDRALGVEIQVEKKNEEVQQ